MSERVRSQAAFTPASTQQTEMEVLAIGMQNSSNMMNGSATTGDASMQTEFVQVLFPWHLQNDLVSPQMVPLTHPDVFYPAWDPECEVD